MENLKEVDLSKVLVIDIETVSQHKNYDLLSEDWQGLWDKKAKNLSKNEESPKELYDKAAIYAEFGKVICISAGIFVPFNNHYKFKVKSFYGNDEKVLLQEFAQLLNSRFHGTQFALAAHNGKEFDYPYLSRRMLINSIKLPLLLDISGKKPWEISLLDTMELWKFGDYKSYTSLQLLAAVFGIQTPKDDIDGSMVGKVFWEENNLERIVTYCQKDVITTAQILLKYRCENLMEDTSISISGE